MMMLVVARTVSIDGNIIFSPRTGRKNSAVRWFPAYTLFIFVSSAHHLYLSVGTLEKISSFQMVGSPCSCVKMLISGQDRSGHQVTLSDHTTTKCLESYPAHSCDPKDLKLTEFHENIDTYNVCISDFWYRWPKDRSVTWPLHYKSMRKYSIASFFWDTHRSTPIISEW